MPHNPEGPFNPDSIPQNPANQSENEAPEVVGSDIGQVNIDDKRERQERLAKALKLFEEKIQIRESWLIADEELNWDYDSQPYLMKEAFRKAKQSLLSGDEEAAVHNLSILSQWTETRPYQLMKYFRGVKYRSALSPDDPFWNKTDNSEEERKSHRKYLESVYKKFREDLNEVISALGRKPIRFAIG